MSDVTRLVSLASSAARLIARWNVCSSKPTSTKSSRELSLLKPSVLVLPPTTGSTLHIVEFSSNFRSIIFPRFENMFHIAIIIAYVIEK
ncbi:hypothetical protein P3T23_007802 [Paraburkholderia sp. GAS448]|uniref:hypothetical protein n=1 Tax=Paraburkholderia sp. GAS448 TaxID=3035136 RepID=UPI003D215AF1